MGPPSTPVRAPGAYPGTPSGGPGGTPGAYYGDGITPVRPGPGMIDMGHGASPDVYGRRITRGMSDGYGAYGN